MPNSDMSDPAGSEPDPNHLDPAGSGSIQIQTRQEEKNYPFCSTTGRNWNDGLPCFVTELLLE